MLRHPRRDRFALSWTPERERREAAFANDETNPGATPEGIENAENTNAGKLHTEEVLRNIAEQTHLSAEATLSVESRENLEKSPLVLDAIGDMRHPTKHVEEVLRSGMERAGIVPAENQGPGDAIAAWHDKKREEKLLNDEQIAKARAEILRNVTEDPETLLALIRSLENQRKRYGEFLRSMDVLTPEGKPLDPAERTKVETMVAKFGGPAALLSGVDAPKKSLSGEPKILHGILTRADAAQGIQSLIKAHGQESVEEWIGQARPDEILHLLDIPAKEMEKPGTLKRAVDLLTDWTNRINFGKFRWNPNDSEPKDNEKRGMQENYFAEMDRHLTGLKVILKEKLEKQANVLSTRVDAEMRRGHAEAAQKAGIEDASSVTAEQWDGVIRTAFEQEHLVTLEDATEEINVAVDRLKRSRGLKIHAHDFIDRATDFLERMNELSEKNVPDLWKHAITEAQRRHGTVQSWIPDFLRSYDAVRPKLDDDKAAAFIAMATGAADAVEVRTRLDELATILRNPSAIERSELSYVQGTVSRLMPAIEGLLSRDYQRAFSLQLKGPTPEEFEQQSGELSGIIDAVTKDLNASRIQNSSACRTAGIPQKLGEEVRSVKGNILRTKLSYEKAREGLEALRADADPDERSTHENLLRAAGAQLHVMRVEMDQLKDALIFIKNLPAVEQAEDTEAACNGYCDYGKQKIYLNRQRHADSAWNVDEVKLARTFDHEFGHLVVDALTERYLVLTGTFNEQQPELERIAKERGIGADGSIEKMLEKAAGEWGLDRAAILEDGETIDATGGPEAYYRRKRWEELLMQYASYRDKFHSDVDYSLESDKEYSAVVRDLFRLLDARASLQENPAGPETILRDALLSKRKALAFSNGTPEEDAAEAELLREQAMLARLQQDAEGGNEPREVAGPTLANFKAIRTHIQFISNYLHTYPEHAAGGLGEIYNNAKEGYEEYFKQFDKHIRAFTENDRMPPLLPEDTVYIPENDGAFGEIIREAINRLKVTEKQIKDFDALKMRGVVDAEPQGKEFWLWFTRDIQWLSIQDYWTMTTEGWEDILRLWKRRGENARGKVGELLTGWIGDKVPYAGQLKHEFHRRQQSSEQEAVSVWEKALENVDSYKLIEDIEHVNNQDHLKAVMILLTKRGRLDWDDQNLWRALNRFSHFKIPIEECHRDPVLLDKWLQKVITDIWTDKDIYRSWKTTNDHSYNSERDKFAEVADFYSSSGLLGSQLEYMLETFVEAKENNKPIPDQVNPHLYEQLFLYAMEKGKMSMQEKFFYLIMGLKWKIIPFDRLAILNGKISTDTFPFIDYFYQQNNTERDIMELAESLVESKTDKKKRFRPGPKTTAFLIEEVAHDEASRQRVTKVISRKGNSIDHEDIPMVTGYMTQGGWNNFLIVSSGALQRITSEGLKNAYVGYNTLFKVYGILAEKKAAVGQTLPPSDVEYLAERIVAFAHYDNVVVRQAIDNNNRPKLSLREIENETMPSGDGNKAKQYRDPVNNLVNEVFVQYGAEIAAELGEKNLRDHEGNVLDYNAFRKEYLGVDDAGDHIRDEKTMGQNDKRGGHIYKMSAIVENALIKAVNRDKGAKLIQLLRDKKGTFTNEGKEQLAFATHKDNFNRQERFARANGGNGHGGGHH